MTVTAVRKDLENLTLTLTAEFPAGPARIWQLWADPRQLERWWGPPTYPSTFTLHDLTPGGRAEYHMTGPGGDQPRGFWRIVEVDEPRSLFVEDGFLNADGTENLDFPATTFRMTIEAIDGDSSRMTIDTSFPSVDVMERLMAMGMEEGITAAVGQIDDILAGDATGMGRA